MLRWQFDSTAVALTLAVAVSVLVPAHGASAASTADDASPTTSGAYAWRTDHPVVISEVASGWGEHPDAGFVELSNVSSRDVDLSGWNLYACNEEGLRAKRASPYTELSGVVLQPGESYLVGRVSIDYGGRVPDDVLTSSPSARGLGFVLEDAERRIADSVAVYPTTPWMTTSECGPQGSLPNTLDVLAGESWQRLGATATSPGRWQIALATPGAPNSSAAPASSDATGVVISELTPFGPNGSGDDLVELRNDGAATVDLEGWHLWRCTATGERTSDTLQVRFDASHALAPGERLVIVGPNSSEPNADATMRVSLADTAFGVQVRDARGALVDEQAVAHQADSVCQFSGEKLPARLDAVRSESWQRSEPAAGTETWVIAPRTPGAENARQSASIADAVPLVLSDGPDASTVVVSELATDPHDVAAIGEPHNFVELSNRGDSSVDLSGWRVWGCDERGLRRPAPLSILPTGTSLEPGEALVVAAEGTTASSSAVATYAEPLHFLGAGVLVENARGDVVDRVGAYHQTEMDESVEPFSVCTNGLSLVTFQPDRLRGETYHRTELTGVDLSDAVTRAASPGADGSVANESRPIDEPRERLLEVRAAFSAARALADAPQLAIAGGTRDTDAESLLQPAQQTTATATGYEMPELTVRLDAAVTGELRWTGTAPARHLVTLSVEEADGSWQKVAEEVADADGAVTLVATVDGVDALRVQVQAQPRSAQQLEPDGAFESPAEIDGTLVHLTDTQYLSEAYPEEYDGVAEWIVDLGRAREVAAVVHTGDLVQGWVDPDQSEPRARVEFERASRSQSILEDAGLVATTLPGNHDTKRGIDTALYNEFFGPDRMAANVGEHVTIAPDDATSSYALVDVGAAPMLVLSIGYGYGERELAWAEEVVRAHPDRNVVVATHEHLTPLTEIDPARRATVNRWLSSGDQLWERVVAPHRNVVAVLSGHYHGLGAIVTDDAGGIEGHQVVELLADYQEFRTATGERATGFLRLLQWDLAAGMLLVDTYSPRLESSVSAPFDSPQFVLETGHADRPANGRPWNIVDLGPEGRYGVADDEFAVPLTLQYDKQLIMTALDLERSDSAEAVGHDADGSVL